MRISDWSSDVCSSDLRQYALEVLARLRQSLDDVEREVLGIGHNNPPEPLSSEGLRREAFNEVRLNIEALESEMEKSSPDPAAVAANSEGLVRFGVNGDTWLGQDRKSVVAGKGVSGR